MIIEARETLVACEIRGDKGPRVVLLHGWGCSMEMMSPLAAALEKDHQVLLIDFPGHGKSGFPPAPWGVPEYAACLKEVLEKADFLPCAAVGHSFGCRVAAWLAADDPSVFTRLVFTGAAGLRPRQSEEGKKRAEAFQKKKRAIRRLEGIAPLRTVAEKMEERLRRRYGSADYNALVPEMRATFVRVVNEDLRDKYPLIRQSTLLIWGDADTETPLWMGQEMEKLIPDAGLVIFEGGSHFAFIEQPERFHTVVRFFLTEDEQHDI